MHSIKDRKNSMYEYYDIYLQPPFSEEINVKRWILKTNLSICKVLIMSSYIFLGTEIMNIILITLFNSAVFQE
jgi:hypothetical protein